MWHSEATKWRRFMTLTGRNHHIRQSEPRVRVNWGRFASYVRQEYITCSGSWLAVTSIKAAASRESGDLVCGVAHSRTALGGIRNQVYLFTNTITIKISSGNWRLVVDYVIELTCCRDTRKVTTWWWDSVETEEQCSWNRLWKNIGGKSVCLCLNFVLFSLLWKWTNYFWNSK